MGKNLTIILIVTLIMFSVQSVLADFSYTERLVGSGADVDNIYDFAVLDFDRDNDLDIITVAYDSDMIVWWVNEGDNTTFTPILLKQDANTNGLRSVQVLDFDGDGDYDIVYSAGLENRIAWLENDGSNTSFSDRQVCESVLTCDDPWSVQVLDFDRDGDYDIVFAEEDDDAVQMWVNDGDNLSFTQTTLLSGANQDAVRHVVVRDYDGDGDYDIVYAANREDRIGIGRNDGSYPFSDLEVCEGSVCDGVDTLDVVDFDRDGDYDIVSGAFVGDQLFWYENIGDNVTFNRNPVASGSVVDGPQSVVGSDMDNDGDNDIVVASYDGDRLAWWENSGDDLSFSEVLVATGSTADGAFRAKVMDFNQDGYYDIVLASGVADRIAWWEASYIDTESPGLDFVPPTPENQSAVYKDWVFVNVSGSEELGDCILDWNGVNESMNILSNNCYLNKTNLTDGVYGFRVYAQDLSGNPNSTGYMEVTVNMALKSISVRLNIGNLDNVVYIPGVGEVNSTNLGPGTTYTDPPHFYLASYLNNLLISLVSGHGKSITVSNTPSYHTIEVEHDLGETMFLAFTKGDWKTIEKRIGIIEAGEFLTKITPTFAFELGIKYPVKILLRYSNIDIQNSLIFNKGIFSMAIENMGLIGGRSAINISKV